MMTKLQILEKQNKDLRARLDNRQVKAEIALISCREDIAALRRQANEQGKTAAMLQRGLASLERENAALRTGAAALRLENSDLRADRDALLGENDALRQENAGLLVEVTILREKLGAMAAKEAKLEAMRKMDSSNSSKPPSSDGFKKIPNNREKSGKKQGGQKGHAGHSLKVPENLDEIVKQGKAEKRVVDLTGGAPEYISKWVVDVEVKSVFTEYRYPVGTKLPPELQPEARYGNGLKTLAVLLSQEGVIAIKRLADFFALATNSIVKPSKNMIESVLKEFAMSIDDDIKAIKSELLAGEVINVDETSMRCSQTLVFSEDGAVAIKTAASTTFGVCVRTYSNDYATFYTVNPQKDDKGAVRDGILPNYHKTIVHDHDKKYYKYAKRNATCGAHLSRDLKGLADLYNCPWALDFRRFMLGMNAKKNNDLEVGILKCPLDLLEFYSNRYDELLAEGKALLADMLPGSFGVKEFRKMLNRLERYKDSYLLFMRDYKVPFTNNLAERDLRSCKTKGKISGCFRTWEGLAAFAKSKSVISTWKKQGLDLFAKICSRLSDVGHPHSLPSGQ